MLLDTENTTFMDTPIGRFTAGIACLIMSVVICMMSFSKLKRAMIIRNTPTEKVKSASTGRTELKGIAKELENSINNPFMSGNSILVDWSISEYNDNANEDEDPWVVIDSDRKCPNFYLEDDTGRIEIDTASKSVSYGMKKNDENSEWKLQTETFEYDRGEEPNKHIKNFCQENNISIDKSRKQKFKIQHLDVGDSTYVFGANVERDSSDTIDYNKTDTVLRTKIQSDPETGYFIISNKDEDYLSSTLKDSAISEIVTSVIIFIFGIFLMISAF